MWLITSQKVASVDSMAWARIQCDTQFLLLTTLFFTHAFPSPLPQPPATTPLHAGGSPSDLRRNRKVRAQGPGLETILHRLGSEQATHPEPGARPPRPGLRQRAAAAATYQRSAGAGPAGSVADPPAGGDGRGTDRLATQAAARIHRPGSRGRQRGPGKREEPASARPAVGGLVRPARSARDPPALEVGSKPPGRWCPG